MLSVSPLLALLIVWVVTSGGGGGGRDGADGSTATNPASSTITPGPVRLRARDQPSARAAATSRDDGAPAAARRGRGIRRLGAAALRPGLGGGTGTAGRPRRRRRRGGAAAAAGGGSGGRRRHGHDRVPAGSTLPDCTAARCS